MGEAIGYAQEIPGGVVFEIGNDWITRRVHVISGRIGTTSLTNNHQGEEYLDLNNSEIEIEISGEGQTVTLDFKEFTFKGYETPNWDDHIRTVEAKLEAFLNDIPLNVSVFYEAKADEDFIRKWVRIEPCALENFYITKVTIENMKLKEMVEGVVPQSRYLRQYENYEDNVHNEPDKANTAEPGKRFSYGDLARCVVTYWGYGEGLYFFAESLLGEETFYRPKGLLMKQRDYVPLKEGLTTGSAIIGAYAGAPELGFKRYNEHLMRNWCVIDEKPLPVSWNTWLVTLKENQPINGNYDRRLLLENINYLKDAGFFDVLHLDLGWEANYPLTVDAKKFPNGISEIAKRAKEVAGLDMGYWINPFSSSYWKSRFESEHPEWLIPNKISGRSGASPICPVTEYFDYVRDRFIALVTEINARVIYWDGNDWNIQECTAKGHGHRNQQDLSVNATKLLAELCEEAHEARPDLIIIGFSLPFDNHRMHALDQQQISDTHSFATVTSELIQRQQLYQMAFEHPYKAIYGSWYGIGWHESGDSDLSKRPVRELIHAEMSMIGNGLVQAGGSFDFSQAPPQLIDVMKKLFAFRKRFEKYFDTYQHVLGFPDCKHIDGEGHIVDGSGFIVLINPTQEVMSVKLPLDEPELELSADKKHILTDWSLLEKGRPIGSATITSGPELELTPLEVKYIGINIA